MEHVLSVLLTDAGLMILAMYGFACAFVGFVLGEQNQRNKA